MKRQNISIKHKGHDHPLLLHEEEQMDYGYPITCEGCKKPISASSSHYGCVECLFFLHKWCAELPPKINHPSHPQHPLFLLFHLNKILICDVCNSRIAGFLYRCSDCDFDAHTLCASMLLHIQEGVDENNKIHQHPLIPLDTEAHFLCAACGTKHQGKSHLCTTCGFWANQTCASAPTIITLRRHPHHLTLFHSFPDSYNFCQICNKEVLRAYWCYGCSEKKCKYLIHIRCVPSEEEEDAENSNKDSKTNRNSVDTSIVSKPEINSITWPLPYESTELITQLIKNFKLRENCKTAATVKIHHCSEGHPLLLLDSRINESKDDQLCDGCGQTISISSPFYHCTQCNFSLHDSCTELPNEIQHISHPNHPLLLITQHRPDFHSHCKVCASYIEGFSFGCSDCKFYLDLKCASLPRVIKHQAHNHTLALRRWHSDPCNACGRDSPNFFCFVCEACCFKLCIECTLLPSTIEHRYDKHSFALTYLPIKGQVDEYYCEICEGDIDSMHWFYHCIECDQSLHPRCIYPSARYLEIKFEKNVKIDYHRHYLCIVHSLNRRYETHCRGCHCPFSKGFHVVWECTNCDFWIHPGCNLLLEKPNFIVEF